MNASYISGNVRLKNMLQKYMFSYSKHRISSVIDSFVPEVWEKLSYRVHPVYARRLSPRARLFASFSSYYFSLRRPFFHFPSHSFRTFRLDVSLSFFRNFSSCRSGSFSSFFFTRPTCRHSISLVHANSFSFLCVYFYEYVYFSSPVSLRFLWTERTNEWECIRTPVSAPRVSLRCRASVCAA